ncbi:hypothetical protein MPTK1_7g17640 [Marchantia polymorpha subsp. ruderalis]|nr:hypothetical protein Mp_7g17640 [Marchantia polymorpha subsp. ruderalis]
MSRTLERTVSLTNLKKLGLREASFSSLPSFAQQAHAAQKQRDEMLQLRFPARGAKKQKTVSWKAGTVDNELMPKKCFEKEFFFSQDIWG